MYDFFASFQGVHLTHELKVELDFKEWQDKNNSTLRTKMALTKNAFKVKFNCKSTKYSCLRSKFFYHFPLCLYFMGTYCILLQNILEQYSSILNRIHFNFCVMLLVQQNFYSVSILGI